MNRRLLLQDAALHELPRRFAIAVAMGLTTLGLIVNLAAYVRVKYSAAFSEPLVIALFSLVMWTTTGAFLWTSAFRQRCSEFAVTLPITAGRLWLTHCLAIGLVGVVIASALTAVGGGVLWAMSHITRSPMLLDWETLVQLGTAVLSTFALATVLIQRYKPNGILLQPDRRFVWMAASALVAGWGFVTLFAILPPLLLVVPGVAAVILGALALPQLPTAMTTQDLPHVASGPTRFGHPVEPLQAMDSTVAEDSHAAHSVNWTTEASGRYGTLKLLGLSLVAMHRAAPKALATVGFGMPGMIFFGLLLSGLIDAFDDDGSAAFRWITVPLTLYLLVATFAKPLRGMSLLDPLPVSRRLLLLPLMLPSLALLGIGYVGGRMIVDRFAPNRDIDLRVVTSSCSGVSVPRSLLHIAWNGAPEAIITPWGESFDAWRVPLYRGARAVIYSPYCTRDTSATDAFVVLQASRASAELYRQSIPESEIRQRYLDAEPAQTNLPLRRDYAGLQVQYEHASLPVLVAFLCCAWFLAIALYLRTFRRNMSDRARKSTLAGLLVLLMSVHLLQLVPFMLNFTEPWIIDALLEIEARALARSIPGGTPSLWGLSSLLIAASYLLAERQFCRAEFHGRPLGVC